ncbi:MAG: hypothetical protein HY286_17355 [Planctomycetes bacterium]|nr:hypothetical protein [Planctomycetota bacterium]
MSKAAGLSKRSISILSEIAKSGGASITADKLAKASGAKGSKGLGGSLTSLRRELSSFGYNIDALIARIKGADGTTFSGMSGSDRAIADIIAKVPQVG